MEEEEVEDEVEEEGEGDDTIPDQAPDLSPVVSEFFFKNKELRVTHQDWYASLTSLVDEIRKKERSLTDGDLADIGFLLRSAERILDDLKKECKAKKELIGKLLCAKMAMETQSVNDANVSTRVYGALGSASADIKHRCRTPKPGSTEYVELCRAMGVNEEAIKAGIFQPHYVRVGEFITQLAKENRDPPKGILSTTVLYNCIFRSRTRKNHG